MGIQGSKFEAPPPPSSRVLAYEHAWSSDDRGQRLAAMEESANKSLTACQSFINSLADELEDWELKPLTGITLAASGPILVESTFLPDMSGHPLRMLRSLAQMFTRDSWSEHTHLQVPLLCILCQLSRSHHNRTALLLEGILTPLLDRMRGLAATIAAGSDLALSIPVLSRCCELLECLTGTVSLWGDSPVLDSKTRRLCGRAFGYSRKAMQLSRPEVLDAKSCGDALEVILDCLTLVSQAAVTEELLGLAALLMGALTTMMLTEPLCSVACTDVHLDLLTSWMNRPACCKAFDGLEDRACICTASRLRAELAVRLVGLAALASLVSQSERLRESFIRCGGLARVMDCMRWGCGVLLVAGRDAEVTGRDSEARAFSDSITLRCPRAYGDSDMVDDTVAAPGHGFDGNGLAAVEEVLESCGGARLIFDMIATSCSAGTSWASGMVFCVANVLDAKSTEAWSAHAAEHLKQDMRVQFLVVDSLQKATQLWPGVMAPLSLADLLLGSSYFLELEVSVRPLAVADERPSVASVSDGLAGLAAVDDEGDFADGLASPPGTSSKSSALVEVVPLVFPVGWRSARLTLLRSYALGLTEKLLGAGLGQPGQLLGRLLEMIWEVTAAASVVDSAAVQLVCCLRNSILLHTPSLATWSILGALSEARPLERLMQLANRLLKECEKVERRTRSDEPLLWPLLYSVLLTLSALMEVPADLLVLTCSRMSAEGLAVLCSSLCSMSLFAKSQRFAIRTFVKLMQVTTASSDSLASCADLAGQLYDSYVQLLHVVRGQTCSKRALGLMLALMDGIQELCSMHASLSRRLLLERSVTMHLLTLVTSEPLEHVGSRHHGILCRKSLVTVARLVYSTGAAQDALLDRDSVCAVILRAEKGEPSQESMNAMAAMLVDELDCASSLPVDGSRHMNIRNRFVVPVMFQLLLHCSPATQSFVLDLFLCLLQETLNLDLCCHHVTPPLLDQLLDILPLLTGSSVEKAGRLLELLGSHSVSVRQLKRMFRMMQSDGEYRPALSPLMLHAIQHMILPRGGTGVTVDPPLAARRYFFLDGFGSGLQLLNTTLNDKAQPVCLAGLPRCPTRGYTLATWLMLPSHVCPVVLREGHCSGPCQYEPTLLSMSDGLGSGMEIKLMAGELCLLVASKDRDSVLIRVGVVIPTQQWTHVVVSHAPPGMMGSVGEAVVIVNGKRAWQGAAVYPKFLSYKPLPHAFVGTQRHEVSHDLPPHSSLHGKMGSFYFYYRPLSLELCGQLHALGLDYMSSFEGDTAEAALGSDLAVSLNAFVVEGGTYKDNSPRTLRPAVWGNKSVLSVDGFPLPGVHPIMTMSARETMDCIGGVAVLFPLFAQFDLKNPESDDYTVDRALTTGVLELLQATVRGNTINQRFMRAQDGFSVLSYLLGLVSPEHLSEDGLRTMQRMASDDPGIPLDLADAAVCSLLANLRLWIYAAASVQDSLLRGLVAMSEAQPRRIRSLMGVTDLLLLMRRCYWEEVMEEPTGLAGGEVASEESAAKLRVWMAVDKAVEHSVTAAEVGRRPGPDDLKLLRSHLWSIARTVVAEGDGLRSEDIIAVVTTLASWTHTGRYDQQLLIEQLDFCISILTASREQASRFVQSLHGSFYHAGLAGRSAESDVADVPEQSGFDVFLVLLGSDVEAIRLRVSQIVAYVLLVCRLHESVASSMTIAAPRHLGGHWSRTEEPTLWNCVNLARSYESYIYALISASCLPHPFTEATAEVFMALLIFDHGSSAPGAPRVIHSPGLLPVICSLLAGASVELRRRTILELRLLLSDEAGEFNCDQALHYGWQHWLLVAVGADLGDNVSLELVLDVFKVLHLHALRRGDSHEEARRGIAILTESLLQSESFPAADIQLRILEQLFESVFSEQQKRASLSAEPFLTDSTLIQLANICRWYILADPGLVESRLEKSGQWWARCVPAALALLKMVNHAVGEHSKASLKGTGAAITISGADMLLAAGLGVLADLLYAAMVQHEAETEDLVGLASTAIQSLSDLCVSDRFPHANHGITLFAVTLIDGILTGTKLLPKEPLYSQLDSVRKMLVVLHRQALPAVILAASDAIKEREAAAHRETVANLAKKRGVKAAVSHEAATDGAEQMLLRTATLLLARDPVGSGGMDWGEWESNMTVVATYARENFCTAEKSLHNRGLPSPSDWLLSLAGAMLPSEASEVILADRSRRRSVMQQALTSLRSEQEIYAGNSRSRWTVACKALHIIRERTASSSFSLALSKWSHSKKTWYHILSSLTNERGPWQTGTQSDSDLRVYWKLEQREDSLRRRMRLKLNKQGGPRTLASQWDAATKSGSSVSSLLPRTRSAVIEGQLFADLRTASALGLGAFSAGPIVPEGADDTGSVSVAAETASAGSPLSVSLPTTEVLRRYSCESITPMQQTPGTLELHAEYMTFKRERVDEATSPMRRKKRVGMEKKDLIRPPKAERWALSEILALDLRRYQLRDVAVELFISSGRSFLFSLLSKKARDNFCNAVRQLRPPNLQPALARRPQDLFRRSGLTNQWRHREISTFEYLMQLNRLAGRTYHDLAQYPVFPWVLKDYESPTLDLTDPAVFRDFSRPMGAQLDFRREALQEKFAMLQEEYQRSMTEDSSLGEELQMITGPPRHYGTHYSNPQVVLWFLLRLEPFSSLHIYLQDGRFDHPDRQFYSMATAWHGATHNDGDVKELIPELFYLPELFRNENSFDLGTKQNGLPLSDVVLPPWARTAEEFVVKHMEALESDYVSEHLHEWIDLVFGFRQTGTRAVEAVNLFHHFTYEGAVDLDKLVESNPALFKNCIAMIENFGQTPPQLLTRAHIARMPRRASSTLAPAPLLSLANTSCPRHCTPVMGESSGGDLGSFPPVLLGKAPIVFLGISSPSSGQELLITIDATRVTGLHKWRQEAPNKLPPFSLDIDPSIVTGSRQLGAPHATEVSPTGFRQLYALTRDGRFALSCSHWDFSFRVTSLVGQAALVQTLRQRDVVTCVAVCGDGDRVVTGSLDSTITVWEVLSDAKSISEVIATTPLHILYGHDAAVNAVACSMSLDLVASASDDGTVIVHTLARGKYIRSMARPVAEVDGEKLRLPRVEWIGLTAWGSMLTYSDDFSLRLYSMNGRMLAEVEVTERVFAFCLSEDTQFLIYGGDRRRLVARSTRTLEEVDAARFSPSAFNACITSCALSPHERHLLVGLANGELWILAPCFL